MRHFLFFVSTGVAGLFIAGSALGHGRVPSDVPVARLVANLARYIEENPNDAEGYYRLGRVHTLALETKSEFVFAFEAQSPQPSEPAEGSWAHRGRTGNENPLLSTSAEIQNHLSQAIRLLNNAIALRPNDARYRLTLASALEAGLPFIDQVDAWPLAPVGDVLNPPLTNARNRYYVEDIRGKFSAPSRSNTDELLRDASNTVYPFLRDIVMTTAYEMRNKPELRDLIRQLRAADWSKQIADQYFVAMTYALPDDGRAKEKPAFGGMEDWVSYEAGKAFIRTVEARKRSDSNYTRLRVAKETAKSFDNLPAPRGVTPIVLNFGGRSLVQIETRNVSAFNLDGSDRPQHWSWVTPDTGILVWDPARSGRITSGRQLFGSVTWWVFFDDGYQALDTLDDNRDGTLNGDELTGLAVWFDRNENGVSDRDEVVPVEDLEISRIACRATSTQGKSPINPKGLTLVNGTTLATYDWISTPITVVRISD